MAQSIRAKIRKLKRELADMMVERDEVINGLIIALLSKNHVFLVGPPGTAKSLIIRILAQSIEGAEYWERLFTRYTLPEEVFGPIKLSALKQDNFERKTDNTLITANFGFIDEIFKANSAILNSLLTAINERIFHNNGTPMKIPLETLLSASNELPEDRDELSALWDRFLVRFVIDYVQEDSSFLDIFNAEDADFDTSVRITFDELHQAQAQVKSVPVPPDIGEAVADIRKKLKAEGIIPSDRRYRVAKGLIQAHAWLQGRKEATTDDLTVLRWALWDEPQHRATVDRIVIEVSNPLGREADELYDAIMSAYKAVEDADETERGIKASEALAKIKKASDKLGELKTKLEDLGRDTDRVSGYIDKAQEITQVKILKDILGVSVS